MMFSPVWFSAVELDGATVGVLSHRHGSKNSNRRERTTGVRVSNGKTQEKVNGPGINGKFEIQ